jgi:putrescine transport system substrate-binding protein
MLDEAVKSDTGIYPDEATFAKLFATTAGSVREQRELTRIWTEVKTGQ